MAQKVTIDKGLFCIDKRFCKNTVMIGIWLVKSVRDNFSRITKIIT